MAAPSTPDAVMSARAALRAQRSILVAAIDAQAAAQRDLDEALRDFVEVPTDPENEVVSARQALATATTNLTNARAAEKASRDALGTAIATWLSDGGTLVSADVDVARLQASQPILMFPARIETRFMGGNPPNQLLVRVYPDEISVDTHESALTFDEEAAGKTYYTGLSLTDPVEEGKRWQVLVSRFGATRAAYIARVMRPSMQQDGSYPSYSKCDSRWAREAPSATPEFPVLPHRPDNWTRPAEAVMPDRWVLAGYRNGQRVLLKAGNPIPEPLAVTIDPGGGQTTTADGFLTDPELAWSTEFATAEQQGMAFTVISTGSTPDDKDLALGYDRLVVVGVKSSLLPFVDTAPNQAPGAPPPDTAIYLERLLDSHHYTRGLALLPQGAATNNIEGNPTAFPPEDPFGDNSFQIERRPPPFHRTISYHCPETDLPGGEVDYDALARTVGVPDGVFLHTFGSREPEVTGRSSRDQERARFMNAALWPVTWGYYLDQVMYPVFKDSLPTINTTGRSYFADHVRGRGPSPAFRVGGVPYGVLPAVSLDFWRRQGATTDDTFEEQLVAKLLILREAWKTAAAAKAPHIAANTDPDPYPAFVNVLAQQASSKQLRVRNVRGPDATANTASLLGQPVTAIASAAAAVGAAIAGVLADPTYSGARVMGMSADQVSDVFAGPLVWAKDLPPPWKYISDLGMASYAALRDDTVLPSGAVRPLLYTLVRQALLLEIQNAARLVNLWPKADFELYGVSVSPESQGFFDKVTVPVYDAQIATRLEIQNFRTSVGNLSTALFSASTDEVERVFTETLDLASYRLDAWITAVATRRLKGIRQGQETARTKPVGGYLGGYAWVENLRFGKASTAPAGGYVHAPSMPQAAAAAVLRNASLTGGVEAASKFAVDLSSERVRVARRILDEVRQGQQLGAVLGYRFERAMRDKHPSIPASTIELLIIALRKLYPLVANKSGTDPNVPADQIAARNVVDGLVLRTKSAQIPWGSGGLPASPTDPGRLAILAEVDALDQLADAVGDLLMAESVYQLVRGNVAGTGATLDALSHGLRPPDPEIARSPRGGVGVTHRIAVAFTPALTDAQGSGWSASDSAPRSAAAASLDVYVGRLIGNVSNVKATVTWRVGAGAPTTTDVYLGAHAGAVSLGLRPLDLVALARAATAPGQGSLLDRRIIDAAVGATAGVTEATVAYDGTAGAFTFPQAMEVARAIGAALVGTRPLISDDLVPPAESSTAAADPTTAAAPEAGAMLEIAQVALDALDGAKVTLDAALGQANVVLRTPLVRSALRAAATFDPALYPDALANADAIDAGGAAASAALGRVSTEATAALANPGSGTAEQVRAALSALRTIFGRDFVATQSFTPSNATEVKMSLADRASLLPAPEDQAAPLQLLEQSARIREPLGRARRVALYAGALGAAPHALNLVQVPFLQGEAWVGPRIKPPQTPQAPPAGRVSCLLMTPPGATLTETLIEGLMLDEWTEIVPALNEETGLAFHYDNPGAEAPQALLAAVPAAADGKWTFAQLLATVNETLDLARLRMLEPDNLPSPYGQMLPAIYVSQHDQNAVPSAAMQVLALDPHNTGS